MKKTLSLLLFALACALSAAANEVRVPGAVAALAEIERLPVGADSASYTWSTGQYSYDAAGNITAIGTQYFVYDAVGRLVTARVKAPDDVPVTQSYGYDAYGNLVTVDSTLIAVSSGTNRLNAAGTDYDAAGNLTKWIPPGKSVMYRYQYDALNMLQSVTVGALATPSVLYIYTADDERLWTFDMAQEQSHWTIRDLSGKTLRDYLDNGTSWSVTRDYVYRDGQMLYSTSGSSETHYSLDHLGTPRLVTDGNGNKVTFQSFLPFGEELALTINDGAVQKFTGHERDRDPAVQGTPLDYMHARYYNGRVGRFLSVDPVMDVNRSTRQPQSWNRYSYVINNPINRIDPDGRMDGNGMGEPAEWSCPGCTRAEQLEQSNQIAKGTAIGAAAVGVVVAVAYCGPTCWKAAAVGAWNWARRNPNAIQQTMNVVEGLASPPSGAISIGAGQLQAKFKHAGDFGVTGNFNKANAAAFGEAIQNHVQGSGTVAINGAYRSAKNLVTYHLDQATSRVVITDRSGNFISAYKATARQVEDIVKKGWGF